MSDNIGAAILGMVIFGTVGWWLGDSTGAYIGIGLALAAVVTSAFDDAKKKTNSDAPVSTGKPASRSKRTAAPAHGRPPLRLFLRYRDEDEVVTEREVSVLSANARSKLLQAHCHLRDDTRSFRYDRVLEAIDLGTGEIIDDLPAFLKRWQANKP